MILIIIFIIILLIIYNYFVKKSTTNNLDDVIKKLLKYSARYASAAEQDNNALIAILHANYATGYLWALKDIASDNKIEMVTGINLDKYEKEIMRVQDKINQRIIKKCPKLLPNISYLLKVSRGL